MSLTIPTQLTGLLGTTAQILGDYNILDEDTAGKVTQASDILLGKGTGVTPSISTEVPSQSVSTVSADATPEQQKANSEFSMNKYVVLGAIGLLALMYIMSKG